MFDADGDCGAALIDAISAGARAESAAIAARLTAIGQLDTLREHELAETIFWTTDPFEEVAAEISAAMRISRSRAGTQIHHARVLRDKLPLVAARFAAGDIDYRVVRIIIDRTETVHASVWGQLDEVLASRARTWMRLSERKMRERIDQQVAKLDANGVRVPPDLTEDAFVQIEPGSPGRATLWANIDAVDGAALDQRLDALANTVCENDPRTHAQRRAAAVGPLARLEAQLRCLCGLPECPAAQKRAAANAAVVHVLAEQATIDGTSTNPGYLPGHGILPAHRVRDLVDSAKLKPLHVPAARTDTPQRTQPTEPAEPSHASEASEPSEPNESTGNSEPTGFTGSTQPAEPADASESPELSATTRSSEATEFSESRGPAETTASTEPSDTTGTDDLSEPADLGEPGYRPSAALSEFIRWRDLTCRFPGCDAPAQRCDIDHSVPYPLGPTHPSNNKLYCRAHHLLKTFSTGWTDRQLPDGTVIFTAPTGHTYVTEPHGAAMFPTLAQPTGDLNHPDPDAPHPNRGAMMPTRRQTREQDRQNRISEERWLRAELNNDLEHERQFQAWIAEHYEPPPPF
ncbi:HNH endonuclease signature motif containing protein [Mycolicibacterium setense]|uniref:HNH endonuclease signature motif containing protein n=1 Tax=Mycolicibacterium setense TaxID=431269 RepID=UPI00057D26EF|nr:HNH endonuclease signature motif containing protein [Mycolicibacterium setense]